MGRIAKLLLSVFVGVLVSACQNTAYTKPDSSLNENNSSRVVVYRPESDWAAVAINFEAYAGEVELGSLLPGGHVSAFVPAGNTVIKVQGHFLSMPDGTPGKQELTLVQGETYYLRFTQRLDGIVINSDMNVLYGGLSLIRISAQNFKLLQ